MTWEKLTRLAKKYEADIEAERTAWQTGHPAAPSRTIDADSAAHDLARAFCAFAKTANEVNEGWIRIVQSPPRRTKTKKERKSP